MDFNIPRQQTRQLFYTHEHKPCNNSCILLTFSVSTLYTPRPGPQVPICSQQEPAQNSQRTSSKPRAPCCAWLSSTVSGCLQTGVAPVDDPELLLSRILNRWKVSLRRIRHKVRSCFRNAGSCFRFCASLLGAPVGTHLLLLNLVAWTLHHNAKSVPLRPAWHSG